MCVHVQACLYVYHVHEHVMEAIKGVGSRISWSWS